MNHKTGKKTSNKLERPPRNKSSYGGIRAGAGRKAKVYKPLKTKLNPTENAMSLLKSWRELYDWILADDIETKRGSIAAHILDSIARTGIWGEYLRKKEARQDHPIFPTQEEADAKCNVIIEAFEEREALIKEIYEKLTLSIRLIWKMDPQTRNQVISKIDLKMNFLDLAHTILNDLSDEEGAQVFDAVLDDCAAELPPEQREHFKKNRERIMKGLPPEPEVN